MSTRKMQCPDDALRFSLTALGTAELHRQLADLAAVGDAPRSAEVVDVQQSDCLLMGLGGTARVWVRGSVGDYAFAHLNGPEVRIQGDAGCGLAEGMVAGSLRLHGRAGAGAGTAMGGGVLAIYSSAGDLCGASLQGGEIFVRGAVGAAAAAGALAGTLVIGGDAGPELGDQMQNAVVYLRGEAASLGRGVVEAPLAKRDQLRLGLLLINAGIRGEGKDFRRIIPASLLAAERARQTGRGSA